ncbi:MAG: adenylyltransferase/cytidyltransferase family protein [Candidatus Roizmanbacteria bacterium]|nr:MAG: adenylyltransferase/cytidyltransferase family protein [Candidatus Roizmanbacteria bacterium]
MKSKTGLIIGRFQPFHKGHLFLINEALKQVDSIIIGIGSASVKDKNNPFSFEERKEFITRSLQKHNLLQKVISILPINDYPSDDDWLDEVLKKVGKFDVAFGNNEWTNGILEKSGYKVVRVPFHKREIYEGVKIREEMKTSKNPHKVLQKHLP